jgi:DNA repair exonuclease SbcCD ATPase subunit
MKLSVKNINFWDDFSIDIDISNYKHILLCGMSGIGKSSILNCIYYAITGLGMTNKWNAKNKKKGIIYLEFKSYDLTIERTLNPKSLTITSNNEIETGDKAQLFIDNIFNLFSTIGYVKQKSTYVYFINMTPKERMLFFEKFLFDNLDIDTIKQKLKEKIDIAKFKYIHVETELNKMEKIEYDKSITLNDIDQIKCEIENLEMNIRQYNNVATELNNLRAVENELNIYIKDNEKELELLTNQQKFIENYLNDEENNYKENKNVIELYEQNIVLHTSFEKLKTTVENKISNIYKELTELKSKLLDLDELEEKIIMSKHVMDTYESYMDVKTRIDKMNFDNDKYQNLLTTVNNLFLYQTECPNCNVFLNVYGSYINIAKERNNDVLNISKLKMDLELMKIKFAKYNILKEEMGNLHSKLSYPILTKDEWDDLNKSKQEQIKLHERYKQLNEEIKNITSYKNITKPPKNKISKDIFLTKKNAVNLYESYQTKYKTNEEMYKKLSEKLNNFKTRMKQINKDVVQVRKNVEIYQSLKNQIDNFTTKLELYNKIYNYNCKFNQLKICKDVWNDTYTFHKLFTKSISDITMHTLNNINFIVQKYIDGFFENDIQFSFYLNEDKNCIDTVVVPDLSILSGGEYDRIVLAIVLAFAEFFKLPLLLLDEIINSLDINTTQKVINHIQQCYPNNQAIIYVGHQTIQGIFDSVICLDEVN